MALGCGLSPSQLSPQELAFTSSPAPAAALVGACSYLLLPLSSSWRPLAVLGEQWKLVRSDSWWGMLDLLTPQPSLFVTGIEMLVCAACMVPWTAISWEREGGVMAASSHPFPLRSSYSHPQQVCQDLGPC